MATDAYQGSGGWTGGSPLMGGKGGVYGGTDSVLGSYMQSMKQYDPLSGSMKTARPQQSNAQMSSLARTIQVPEGTPAAYNTQPTAATPTTQAPVTVNVQAPAAQPQQSTFSNALLQSASSSAPAGMQLAQGRNLRAVGGQMPELAPSTGPSYTAYTSRDVGGIRYNMAWDANSGRWVVQSRSQIPTTIGNAILHPIDTLTNAWAPSMNQLGQAVMLGGGNFDQGNIDEATRQATDARKDLVDAYNSSQDQAYAKARQEMLDRQAAEQKARDDAAAAAAQDALDKASAFNLTKSLQAPDTSASDRAGDADLARLLSKYRASGYGPEASSLAAIGARDAGTQATLNKVNHDSAYASAYNSNYGVFADALRARRDTNIAASGQRLNYDMQGVSQAVALMTQQAQQLGDEAKTKTLASLQPLKDALRAYDVAVAQYKADSSQAKDAAAMVLSLGGSLAAAAV